MSWRLEKVSELIRRELSFILARKFGGKGVIFTMTKVDVSPDVRYADIYFVVMPEEEKKNTLNKFNSDISSIQELLNKRLRMRPVPKIRFHLDREEEAAKEVEEILDTL
jgi:ribosome-binding factor A